VLATELAEQLLAKVAEFGDGEVRLPDPLESWWYPVYEVSFEHGKQEYRLSPEFLRAAGVIFGKSRRRISRVYRTSSRDA
jgi:hypothetical protein